MGRCNLEMSDKCYGCGYYGTGDIDGCKLTIEFCKKYMKSYDKNRIL